MKDILIIFLVLLVLLILISTLGGSIRFNEKFDQGDTLVNASGLPNWANKLSSRLRTVQEEEAFVDFAAAKKEEESASAAAVTGFEDGSEYYQAL